MLPYVGYIRINQQILSSLQNLHSSSSYSD